MGDLLGEGALESNNILYRSVDFLLDRKAALFQPSQKPVAGSFRIKCQKSMKKMKEA
jgi:hypothetical protein